MKKIILIIYLVVGGLFLSAQAQTWIWSEPQIVEGINFGRTDWSPSISSDGMKLYFASTRSNNEDLYVSERVNGVWTTPVNLGEPVNSNQRDLTPSISYDGRTLYFASYARPGGYGSYDIWYSEWQDSTESWGEPINAGPKPGI